MSGSESSPTSGGAPRDGAPPGGASRAFARFARSRDAEDFAAAFDATASDLWLFAVRLGAGDAEDLVQQTWHRAIDRAAHFDPSRPLLPWLIGILIREAQRQRRDVARRDAHGRAWAVGLEAYTEEGPRAAAESAELSDDVARALDGIDARQREVLILRLRHGLSSAEIGRALGRSPDTVRSQLARGLQRLRGLLPTGHALPAVALADLGAGGEAVELAARLEAIRHALLSAHAVPAAAAGGAAAVAPATGASAAGVSATGVSVTGSAAAGNAAVGSAARGSVSSGAAMVATGTVLSLAMSKKIFAVVGVLLVVWLGWQLVGPPSQPVTSVPTAAGAQPNVGPAVESSGRAGAAGTEDPERAVVAAPEAMGSGAWLAGRVLGSDPSGANAGIDGARVRVVLVRGRSETLLGDAVSSADGSYRVALEDVLGLSPLQRQVGRLEVRADAEGFLAGAVRTGELPRAAPSTVALDVTLESQRGIVTGQVVDPSGVPVPDVRLFWIQETEVGEAVPGATQRGVTDADGRFRIAFAEDGLYALGAGSYREGLALRAAERFTADQEHDLGVVALQRGHAELHARLVLCDGTPAPDLRVDLAHVDPPAGVRADAEGLPPKAGPAGPLPLIRARETSDENGELTFRNLLPGRYRLTLRDELGESQRFEVDTGPGQRELRLSGQLIELQVAETGGDPLPGCALFAEVWRGAQAPGVADLRAGLRVPHYHRGMMWTVEDATAVARVLTPWNTTWRFRPRLAAGVQPSTLAHRAEPGVGHVKLRLDVESLQRTGTVRFEFLRADGSRIRETTAWLEDPSTDIKVFGARLPRGTDEPWTVPAGRWRFRAEPGAPLLGEVRHLPDVLRDLTVVEGRETVVRFRAPDRGLLRLELTGAAGASGGWKQVAVRIEDGETTHDVELAMRSDDPGDAGTRDWSVTTLMPTTVEPGQQLVPFQPVSVGEVTVTVRADGCQPVARRVVIRPDAVHHVEIPMLPE